MYQRALAIRARVFEWKHPAVQSVVQGYARSLRMLHREEEAQVFERRGKGFPLYKLSLIS